MTPFCERAIRAIHRAERDAFGETAEALGVTKASAWPHASKWAGLRDSGRMFSKLWIWSLKRYGQEFSSWEYKS